MGLYSTVMYRNSSNGNRGNNMKIKLFKKTQVFNETKYSLTWQGDILSLILAGIVVYTVILLVVEGVSW